MTTVAATFAIRSFRRADDPHFLRALDIYNRSVHYQAKTDVRDIAYWLENERSHPYAKLYFCGLFEGTQVIGYLQFAYFPAERLVHVDYFVVAEEHRSRGRFYLFAEQFGDFLQKEHLSFNLITAEISLVDEAKGQSGYAEKLIRLFRSTGLGELKVDYLQPMLGWGSNDTSIPARLMVFFPVPATKLSVSRYIEILKTIYWKHYRAWYKPLYPEHDASYLQHIEQLTKDAEEKLKGVKTLDVDIPDSEFAAAINTRRVGMRRQIIWFAAKLILSAVAAAFLHWFLANRTEWNPYYILGAVVACFTVVAMLLTLRTREQLEATKFFLSVVRDFFSH